MGMRIESNNPAIQGATQQAVTRQTSRLAGEFSRASAPSGAPGISARVDQLRVEVLQYTQQANALQVSAGIAQVAEKGMAAQGEEIAQLRAVAAQAADAFAAEPRDGLNEEAQAIVARIDQIARDTTFNGQTVLAGRGGEVAARGGEENARVTLPESTAEALGLNRIDLTTAEGASAAVSAADIAQVRVDRGQALLQAQTDRFARALEQRRETGSGLAAQERLDSETGAQQAMEQLRAQLARLPRSAALVQGAPSTQLISKYLS